MPLPSSGDDCHERRRRTARVHQQHEGVTMHPIITELLVSARQQEFERSAETARTGRSFRSSTTGRRHHVRSSLHRIGFRG